MAEAHVVSGIGPDVDAASLFTRSAVSGNGSPAHLSGFWDWWADRQAAGQFEVSLIPFAELDRWHFDPSTGNLAHESGRFFTVEGLRISDTGIVTWTQPVMNQQDIAILGILAKEFDGELHFLMQAKMEPGNLNALQLSPTVQATHSNYTRVHRGAHTRYLEYFRGPDRGLALVDVLQSELGGWFLAKRNRNMVMLATGDVPEHPDFRWLTLGQIRGLIGTDNLVNMDARTVLACMPLAPPAAAAGPPRDAFTAALLRSYDRAEDGGTARHTEREVLSWFTEAKSDCVWRPSVIPLAEVAKWATTSDEIVDDERQEFRIVAVRVEAGNREITRWGQPLLAPFGQRVAAFFARPIDGVLHLLVQGVAEPGLRDLVEIGPTVQLPIGADPMARPADEAFVELAMTADPSRVRYDTVLSEEGGRFYHALTRYRVIDVGEDFPLDVPGNYCWLTVRQLMDLVRHAHYLNIEARSLLACVHSLW